MAAIGRKDFDRWTPAETDMFMEVKRFVQDGYDQIPFLPGGPLVIHRSAAQASELGGSE